MHYQEIVNALDNKTTQTFKFSKHWIKTNDASGTYSSNSQIKFKTTMLK